MKTFRVPLTKTECQELATRVSWKLLWFSGCLRQKGKQIVLGPRIACKVHNFLHAISREKYFTMFSPVLSRSHAAYLRTGKPNEKCLGPITQQSTTLFSGSIHGRQFYRQIAWNLTKPVLLFFASHQLVLDVYWCSFLLLNSQYRRLTSK